jgi:hypothetical protein
MIHLPLKENNNAPARLSLPGALRQITRAISNSDGELYNSSYYPHEDIVNLLKAYSIHKMQLQPGDLAKCNYCESKIEHAATLQVEHYRPKAKVDSGENDHQVLPGYYWLGLEWTNLLLACPKCNGKDAKGNKFPIRGVRAQVHNTVQTINAAPTLVRANCYANEHPLALELPILLNPEIDHPEEFLTFDILGNISGHGNDHERGNISRDIYRLNRDELLICRQKVWKEFRNEINVDIAGHMGGYLTEQGLKYRFMKIAEKLRDRKLPIMEYTLWGRYINDNLVDFLDNMDDYYKDLILEVYNDVANGNAL